MKTIDVDAHATYVLRVAVEREAVRHGPVRRQAGAKPIGGE